MATFMQDSSFDGDNIGKKTDMNLILVVSSLRSLWIHGSIMTIIAMKCTNSITFCMLGVILEISRDSIIPYRLFLWP